MKKMLQDATVRYDYMATMHFGRSGIGGINKNAWMACTRPGAEYKENESSM